MTSRSFFDGRAVMHHADSRDALKTLADASVDSVVCDPPYALVSIVKRFGAANAAPGKDITGASGPYTRASAGFMGQQWDTGETAFAVTFWAEVLRVLKPGGHVVAFSGTRTYHRLAVAIEDAGFEIRDQLAWVYGTGFPKSHDVALGFEKTLAEKMTIEVDGKPTEAWFYVDDHEPLRREPPFRHNLANEWAGWGTALKPAWEPIVLARKPLIGTVVANVLTHGTGALNIDACRIEGAKPECRNIPFEAWRNVEGREDRQRVGQTYDASQGRWPANIVHDGSPEVLAGFPETAGSKARVISAAPNDSIGTFKTNARTTQIPEDAGGSAARFFYCAKASKKDRAGSKHPTVKPVALMRWLVGLVTPPGGTILEPFAGSGSTLQAAIEEGASVIGIEREATFFEDCCRRLEATGGLPRERREADVEGLEAPEPAALPAPARRKRGDPHVDQPSFLAA